MRILVVTVVHRPNDARIYARQIRALVAAGHDVTLAAPWTAWTARPLPDVDPVDLPRAVGRDRRRAVLAARDLIRKASARHDLVMIHNPELVPVAGVADVPVVFDVHEDLGASLRDKAWLPTGSERLIRPAVRWMEHYAERRFRIILAEPSYQQRFRQLHPVVPNEPVVPEKVDDPGETRVVHLGRHSVGRGLHDLVALSELAPHFDFEFLGWADTEVSATLDRAAEHANVTWLGEIENELALSRLEGALAGVSLLHDLPNYRHSRPTKIVEYMSRGIPVITTPLPVAEHIVERHRCGLVVPFEAPEAVMDQLNRLSADVELRETLGRNGHLAATRYFDWKKSAPQFVELIELWGGS